jgi:O-antigen ligase
VSASIQEPIGVSIPAFGARDASLHWEIIAQMCMCVIPGLSLVAIGAPVVGARVLAISLALMVVYHLLKGNRYELMALVLASLPAVELLRGLFLYSGVVIFLTMGLLLWTFSDREKVQFVWRDLTWRWLVFLSVVYWWLSVLHLHHYSSNERMLEYVLSCTAVYLLANRRSWLATVFVGVAISSTFQALSLLPYPGRLGVADIDNQHVGNPILMGIPSAMVVLIAMADKGRWLLLEQRPLGRMILVCVAGEWLVLSGSRGSWTVTIVGLVLLILFSKLSRKPVLICLAAVCLITTPVLLSSRGMFIKSVFTKTVDTNRTMKNRTSFRSEQWAIMPKIFAASPIWGWGPGSGREVDLQYTGRSLAWHSLYLQVIGETGLMGMVPLVWILGSLVWRAIKHLRRWGEITPLIGIAAYMAIGISVSAFDGFSGIFLGLAFIAREATPRLRAQEGWLQFDTEESTQPQLASSTPAA